MPPGARRGPQKARKFTGRAFCESVFRGRHFCGREILCASPGAAGAGGARGQCGVAKGRGLGRVRALRFMSMKLLLCFLLVVAGSGMRVLAAGGDPAKTALKVLSRERGASWLENVVFVGGERGTDQPVTWHVVVVDGQGALRSFYIAGGRVTNEGPVPGPSVASFSGPFIAQKKLTVDSTAAFAKAEVSAKAARLGFDSATYQLRAGQGGAPVWYLELKNTAGQKVADVSVNGSSGKVLRFQTYAPPPPQAQVPPPQPGQKAAEAVNRGVQGIGRGLNRAGQWIQRKLGPNP